MNAYVCQLPKGHPRVCSFSCPQGTRCSHPPLRFGQTCGLPPIHFIHFPSAGLRSIYVLLALRPHPSPAKRDSGKMLYISPPTRCRATLSTTCHSKLAVNNKRNISDGGLPEMAKQNKRDPAMLEMQIMSTWTRQSRCARNPRRTNRCRSPTDVSGYAHLCD